MCFVEGCNAYMVFVHGPMTPIQDFSDYFPVSDAYDTYSGNIGNLDLEDDCGSAYGSYPPTRIGKGGGNNPFAPMSMGSNLSHKIHVCVFKKRLKYFLLFPC